MDYKSGEVYLNSRQREMLSSAILCIVNRLSKMKAECADLGVGNDFYWQIENYLALLKTISEE